MEYVVTKINEEIKGSQITVRAKYKFETIETVKDIAGKDTQVYKYARDATKNFVVGRINQLTTKITQMEEEKSALEKALTDIETIEAKVIIEK